MGAGREGQREREKAVRGLERKRKGSARGGGGGQIEIYIMRRSEIMK